MAYFDIIEFKAEVQCLVFIEITGLEKRCN